MSHRDEALLIGSLIRNRHRPWILEDANGIGEIHAMLPQMGSGFVRVPRWRHT